MDKSRLDDIVRNPSIVTADDIFELENLANQYPYAQFLHVLLAKIAGQYDTEQKDHRINTAAIYISDRAVLKKIVTDPSLHVTLPPGTFQQYHQKPKPHEVKPEFADTTEPTGQDVRSDNRESDGGQAEVGSDALFEEVMKNLETLRALRKQYEFLEQQENAGTQDAEARHGQSFESRAPLHSGSDKTDSLKDETDEKENEGVAIEIETAAGNVITTKKDDENNQGSVVRQPVANIRKYQDDLISRFIEKDPDIKSVPIEAEKPNDPIAKDLSADSINLNENLVSENLANLFVKQGKTEKAIDIYKKLIWKFPQKKAYFAAQIEGLKKN